jgi:hypothetical protein
MLATAILSILLVSSSASASSDNPAPTQAKPEKPKKVCKTIAMTGSRLGRRECKTKEQWQQAEYAAELSVKGAQGTTQPPQFPTGG